MITLYSGTPGSGKSLHVADLIIGCLRFNKPVIANFEINPEIRQKYKGEFTLAYNWELCPEFLIKYAEEHNYRNVKEGHFTLIIDEAQLMFNSRSWNAKGRENWTWFFTQHRKYKFDVILVAQFDRMLDRQIRSLIEYEYKHRKVKNIGTVGLIMSLFAGGSLFVAVHMWYPMNQKVGSEFFRYRRKLGQLYDTAAVFTVEKPLEHVLAPVPDNDKQRGTQGALLLEVSGAGAETPLLDNSNV